MKEVFESFFTDVEKEPKEGYFFMGNILNNIGDKKGAIEKYEKAVELDPNYKEALFSLGKAWDYLDYRYRAI